MNAVELLEEDLRDCAVSAHDVQAVGARYSRAITSGLYVDWVEMYVGVFAALIGALREGGVPEAEPLDRVLRLINDDLGSQLFDAQARAEVSRYAYAYARVVALDEIRENARTRVRQAH